MTRISRAAALTAAAISLTFALAGCFGPTPTPTPTPDPLASTPTADPTPTAEPVDPLTTVTALVARPEALELHDGHGAVVGALDYLSAPPDAIATLTAVFEAAPVSEEYDGSSHFPPSTAHRWDGFTLWEQRYVDRWEGVVEELSLARPAFMVEFTGPSVVDVDLTTSDARHAGDGWQDLLANPTVQQNPSECSGPYADFVSKDGVTPDGTPYVLTVSVEFQPSEDRSAIARIAAPVPVQEGCA